MKNQKSQERNLHFKIASRRFLFLLLAIFSIIFNRELSTNPTFRLFMLLVARNTTSKPRILNRYFLPEMIPPILHKCSQKGGCNCLNKNGGFMCGFGRFLTVHKSNCFIEHPFYSFTYSIKSAG